MNYIEISINRAFLIKTVAVLSIVGGSYMYGNYQYKKGIDAAFNYIMKVQGQPAPSEAPNY